MVPLVLSLIDHLPDPTEDRLARELALLQVDVTAVPAPGFASATLEERLAFLREHEVTPPVAWLSVSDRTVQVSIATLTDDRASLQLVEVPRDPDAPADLALGVREILAQLAPPPVDEESGPRLRARVGTGLVVPTARLASGPRALVQGEGLASFGPAAVGVAGAFQIGDGQWRVGLGPTGRLGPALVAARLDLVHLPWVTWGQPRLEVGGTLVRGRFWAEARLGWAPQRDVVEQDDRTIYDSGRFECTFVIGLRQMWTR